MTTTYPAKIDTITTLPLAVDNLTPVQASIFNNQRNAVLAIETALGVQPEGIYGTVAGRFATLENIVGNLQIIRLAKDLGGTLSNPLVIGLQGNPVSTSLPSVGEVLTWDGIAWVPATASGSGGSGNIAAPTISIQSNNVSGSTSAGLVTIQGGNALGTGKGGTLRLEGGNGGATNGPAIVINGSQNPTAGTVQILSSATNIAGALVVDGSGNVSSTGFLPTPGWQTVLDLNFAAQPNQTLGTDGNFTIAGLTWTKENSASDASPMAIVNGTGLTITPTNGPDYNFVTNYTGQRTCPLLRIPFSQFSVLSNMTWQSKVRIWVSLTPQSLTFGGYYRVFAAMDSGPDVSTNGAIKISVWSGGGNIDNNTVNASGVDTVYTDPGPSFTQNHAGFIQGTFGTNNQALMLELDRTDGGAIQYGYFGSYAGANWPSYYALNRIDGVTQGANLQNVSGAPIDVRQMGIVLGAVTQNPGPAASVQRIRVDVLI